ncbi:hypothetical protein BDZ97DRAFT_1911475 [Flammula alnicola]|nr:hypothetical protein BDZ97DRAFT_1911475 [Flammula alnicola]
MAALDSTFGIWLVALFLETLLYGIGLLQVWLYFHWYPNDSWWLKSVVTFLLIIETLQITLFFGSTYVALIQHFGQFDKLFVINWMDEVTLIAGVYLSAFVVQLGWRNVLMTVVIVLLALAEIGAGIAQTVATTNLGNFTKLGSTKAITSVQSGSALACDIVVTVSLVYAFNERKSELKTTNTMLQMLIVNAINRGALTAISAALNFILFLSLPGTFYFFIGLMPSSKLYMNSMLATLNTRQHIRSTAASVAESSAMFNSIPIRNLSRGNTAAAEMTQDFTNTRAESFELQQSSTKKGKFIDELI